MLERQPHENGAPDPPRGTRYQNSHRSILCTCGSRRRGLFVAGIGAL